MDNGAHPNLDPKVSKGADIAMSGVNSFGVGEMLRRLRDEGYPTTCATMSHLRQVRRVLSVLDLDDAFDLVVTMDDVGRGKPDPETLPDVGNRRIEEAGGGLR